VCSAARAACASPQRVLRGARALYVQPRPRAGEGAAPPAPARGCAGAGGREAAGSQRSRHAGERTPMSRPLHQPSPGSGR